MNTRMALVLMLAFGAIIGFMASSFFSASGGTVFSTPPPGHEQLANLITIQDTTMGKTLAPVFVRSGTTVPLSMIPLAFTGAIKYSVWEYRLSTNDASTIMVTALVWGPGTANEYFVEVARLSPDAFTVSSPNGQGSWTQGGNDGFMYFQYG